ncbi:OLC1v1019147C1 [Oldenlandia corymbosa var. corymbosa]|uniref:OLC1v1019147C1 n=1 Tax=Oldenlandia corymbosa var. corymbosa TaxID=529605 RepID=A0AAV1ED83_OLDCO|nr:OLC1v1019147C1 [Oldenlandia corymbosa var. corymbosa]
MPDDGLFVEERLSYEGLISKICMTLGWDPAHVKLHLSLIFDSPGGRRVVKIKNDSHVEFMNRVDPMSCLDLYIDLEDITQEEREASLENMSFGDFRRGERASTSRNRDEEETPLFAQNDYREELDSDYIAPSESEEDYDVSGESDFEESDDERLENEERDCNLFARRHVYSKMGNWDASCVDKDEFALKMWDETPEGMDIGVCFKSQSEAKHAVKLWNIHHKREYTVAASSPRTWAVRCRTFNVESEDGEPPCEWKMRVSLKAHGLHEIVRWHDAHNCMTPVNDNDNRCVDASLIARLIRRKVEDNVDYTVASAQKDVKTLLKVDVPYKRAWHGRRKAIEAVYGDWTSNFEELPRYIAALKFTNPETVVEWEWKEGQEGLLSAMSQMDEWRDLGDGGHFLCLRHVRSNLVSRYNSKEVKRLCWKMGTTLSRVKYNRMRAELIEFKPAAWEYLRGIGGSNWARLKAGLRRWGIATTNISESYNNALKGIRFLPIRALIDATFRKTVKFYREEQLSARNCMTPIPPELWKKYEKMNDKAASFEATPFDGDDAMWRVVTATRLSGRGGSLHTVWAYERIERIAPQRKGVDYLLDETAPLAQRYTYGDAPRSSTPPFRDQLTSLRVEDFRWQPYAHVLHRLPDFCTQGQAIWTTRCWMFCWAIREPHESGRVVRQFGYIQDVPKHPMIKDNAAFLLDHAHIRRHWNRREEFGEVLNNIRVSTERFRENEKMIIS